MKYTIAALALAATPLAADPGQDAFVDANVLGIFYHELGHAIIDLLELPVFGQEEDAADVASILLIDQLWGDEAALDLAYGAADGFYAEALATEADEIAYWGVHGPDEQRFYNTVCLFYGGNPDARAEFAADMGLPEDRAETCPEEYDLALGSWGAAFDSLAEQGGVPMTFVAEADGAWVDLLAAEVETLNSRFSWSVELTVSAGPCGEANAFYDPNVPEIRMCSEFVPYLVELYAR